MHTKLGIHITWRISLKRYLLKSSTVVQRHAAAFSVTPILIGAPNLPGCLSLLPSSAPCPTQLNSYSSLFWNFRLGTCAPSIISCLLQSALLLKWACPPAYRKVARLMQKFYFPLNHLRVSLQPLALSPWNTLICNSYIQGMLLHSHDINHLNQEISSDSVQLPSFTSCPNLYIFMHKD